MPKRVMDDGEVSYQERQPNDSGDWSKDNERKEPAAEILTRQEELQVEETRQQREKNVEVNSSPEQADLVNFVSSDNSHAWRSSTNIMYSTDESSESMGGQRKEREKNIINREQSSNSRLRLEFKAKCRIGKGGFGKVYKVENQLDGNAYAIKRIILKPKSKELNRKIIREVKHLSNLNHENVVRYFCSWIEEVSEGTSSTEEESDPSDSGILETEDILTAEMTDNESVLVRRPHVTVTSSSEYDDGIDFVKSEGGDEGESSKRKHSPFSTDGERSTDMEVFPKKCMYIQMELCEEGTLRTSIDQEIYKDEKKLWSFFRQILEGLVHIHSQNMIHRDLKPDNIFLASNGLVKIGDFGLARSEQETGEAEISQGSSPEEVDQSQDSGKNSLTSKVGTALYASPELCEVKSGYYNQKVDLFSLGIIFFEMCSPPFTTGMERREVLGSLRQETIEMPESFSDQDHKDKTEIIKWLLNHDPAKRPTAKELLKSPNIPHLEIEEARIHQMIGQTVSDNKSRCFKHLMGQLFSQMSNPKNDFSYDMDEGFDLKQTLIQRTIHESLTRLCMKHGAVTVTLPLLMPKNSTLNTESCTFMDKDGALAMLPHDLRVPFARYVACNSITRLKRYAIQKVYSEEKVNCCHLREHTECAFDIVTNTTESMLPHAAEVIYIVSEIIGAYPKLQEKKHYFIQINHSSLLKAILSHCSIPQEKHEDVFRVLREAHIEMAPMEERLAGLTLSEQEICSLVQFIELGCSLEELSTKLKPLTGGSGSYASIAEHALKELQAIISHAKTFGVRQKIMVTPSLVHDYYSGLVFQFVAHVTCEGQVVQEKLAVGGRYDTLIQKMINPLSPSNQSPSKAVGVSIYIDEKVASLLHDETAIIPVCDVLVCVRGTSYSTEECIQIRTNLWNSNLRADICYDTSRSLEDIQEYCKTSKVSHIVLLKDNLESGMVKLLHSIDLQGVVESTVALSNLAEILQKRLASDPSGWTEPVAPQGGQLSESSTAHNQTADISVTFLTENNKLDDNQKKTIERQIQSKIMQVVKKFNSKVMVEVIAVDLPIEVVKNFVAILDLESDESSFQASVQELCQKYSKYPEFIQRIANDIRRHKERPAVVILYSYTGDGFKVFH